jgi:hypothetical protein
MRSFSDLRKIKLNESSILYAQSVEKKKTTPSTSAVVQNNKIAPESEETAQEKLNHETAFKQIAACVEQNTPKQFKLNDGTIVSITPIEAQKIYHTYEDLNVENQGIFESMINENIKSHQLMVEFSNNYIN